MDKIKFIKENWGKLKHDEMTEITTLNLGELLKIAFDQELYQRTPLNNKRSPYTDFEDEFIRNYSQELTLDEMANILYRPRLGVYQRSRLLSVKTPVKFKRKRKTML